MELKLGFMSDKEIAEWSGKELNTFKKNRKRWCKTQLCRYADYMLVKGGVKIIKIIEPIYYHSAKKEIEEKFLKFWGTPESRIDSCRNCWNKMSTHLCSSIADSTGYNYVAAIRHEWYGTFSIKNNQSGTKGSSYPIYCKIINGEGYRFTEEEEAIKQQLLEVYWFRKGRQIVEIKELQFKEILEEDKDWSEFKNSFEKIIKCSTGFRIELIERAD